MTAERATGTPGQGRDGGDAAVVRAWLLGWAAVVAERRAWLTELDAAIGDGDHGINLDRGLRALAADLASGTHTDGHDTGAGALLATAGRRLMRTVGGASGALYGRGLKDAGAAVDTAAPRDPAALGIVALTALIAAVADLGKGSPGDKTMLDALVPALDALRAAPDEVGPAARLAQAAAAAASGSDATIPLVARRGRASYLGDRSAGHRDPGAASSALLVACLAKAAAGDGPAG